MESWWNRWTPADRTQKARKWRTLHKTLTWTITPPWCAGRKNGVPGVILTGTTRSVPRTSGRMGCVPFAAGQAKARPRHRTRHSKARFHTQNKNQAELIKVQQTPCNIYLGENFATKLQAAFQFERSLQQADFEDGFVQCRFDPFKRYHEMTLSGMAARMKECPNAGGDSVESEVLR